MTRSLVVLTLAHACALSAIPIVVLLGGIIGARLAPNPSLITLPVALMIVGTALTAIPAAMLMGRIGRKAGFLFAAAYATAAGVAAAFAISQHNFILFCVATFFIGSHNAFIQQYRFALAESVPAAKVAPSLSVLMLAGVVAAYVGPEVANRMQFASDWGEFSGSFLAGAALSSGAFFILCFYSNVNIESGAVEKPQRPLFEIISQSRFVLAVAASAVGFAVMSFIMTATPVSMHSLDHFSLDDTTWVIQSHIMAMYLPSFFSGILIARFGPQNIITAGVGLLFVCLGVAITDHQLMHYWWALVLLGIGWNFLFLGGTTLLTQTYHASERFKVQAFNDAFVFTPQAIAALGSGFVLAGFGWHWIMFLSLPLLVLLLALLFMNRDREGFNKKGFVKKELQEHPV